MSIANPTILVVEDEALIAMSMESTLNEAGMNVLMCGTLREAVESANTATINFALLDYSVGSGDTHEVAEILKRRGIPFAICSGTDPKSRGHFLDTPYLPKPFQEIDLTALVAGALA